MGAFWSAAAGCIMVVDLLIINALVLTLEPGGPISRGYVAVQDGDNPGCRASGRRPGAAPGPADPGPGGFPGSPRAGEHPLPCPHGLVPGPGGDLPLKNWLTNFIFPAEASWLDPEKAYWGALAAAAEMIRGGITTVADGYFFEIPGAPGLGGGRPQGGHRPGSGGLPRPRSPRPRDRLKVAADFSRERLGPHPGRASPRRFSAILLILAGTRP